MFDPVYPHPTEFRRPDGTARYAFVTFLIMNDSYLPGALMLAYALHKQHSQAERVCLVTPQVPLTARPALGVLFDRVLEVEPIVVPHKRKQQRQYLPFVFTRFHALRMGRDGDMGLAYEKIVLLDADVLPLAHYDHLFTLDPPAGIINERKTHLLEWDRADGQYLVTEEMARTGRWIWHQLYEPLCPHGQRIPQEITDRAREDPSNVGIHGSLYLVEPSMSELQAILADLERPETRRLVGDLFDWPDQQYLTGRWSGSWTSIDLRFSGYNGYPILAALCGTHYAGIKPWSFKRATAIERYGRYDDFQLWFHEYLSMMKDYPELENNRRLHRLRQQVQSAVL